MIKPNSLTLIQAKNDKIEQILESKS